MRRSLFIFLVAGLVAFGVYRWQQVNSQLHGGKRAGQYTPADGPKIDPKDVQVLSALDSEYTRLVQAVVPSVVSITSSRRVTRNQRVDLFEFLFQQSPHAAAAGRSKPRSAQASSFRARAISSPITTWSRTWTKSRCSSPTGALSRRN